MIYVILGPTCSGKSNLAIKVAELINGEIVNADPYQCYIELNIGVAKPSKDDFNIVKHHLYNIQHVDESLNIYEFQKIFRNCMEILQKEGKNIVVVSGSGLYLKSSLYDYEFVNLNDKNKDYYESLSNDELYEKLVKIDKDSANKIHVNNRKRLIQALLINDSLEVGESKDSFENQQKHVCIFNNIKFVGLNINRDELYKNINSRVDLMIEQGLEVEASNLFSFYGTNLNAFQAIGYKEFNLNNLSTEEKIDLIKKNTRNYAKRQMTFFKHQFDDVNWFNNVEDAFNFIKDDYESNI